MILIDAFVITSALKARASNSREIEILTCVHHDLLANVDEQGHLNYRPSLEGGCLGATVLRVALI